MFPENDPKRPSPAGDLTRGHGPHTFDDMGSAVIALLVLVGAGVLLWLRPGDRRVKIVLLAVTTLFFIVYGVTRPEQRWIAAFFTAVGLAGMAREASLLR